MKTKIIILFCYFIAVISLNPGCTKEEVNDGTSDFAATDSLTVENRNGQFSGVYYMNTNTFAFPQKNIQIAFNRDSIRSQSFRRSAGSTWETFTKVLGTLDPSYQNKPARKYDITINFRDTTYFFSKAWIKDTSAVNFNKIGSINLIPGKDKVYQTIRTDEKLKYYDTNYKTSKDMFTYDVKLDSLQYKIPIPANNTGTIFWLTHKM